MPWKLIPPGERRNRSWLVRGTHAGIRFETSTRCTDRRAAEQFAVDYVAAIARGPALQTVTFRAAAERFLQWRRPGKDDEGLVLALVDYFGGVDIRSIVHSDLVRAAEVLRPGASNATKNRKVLTPAAGVLHYAADQGWCEYRRFRKFPTSRKSTRQPATPEAIATLMAATDGRKRLLLAVLYETGLRITDALRLRWQHVDLKAARIVARSSKTDTGIAVPISPSLVAMLAATPREAPTVFQWTSRMSVYKWLRPLCRELGIAYTPHMSRHALATWLAAAGVPDKLAAEHGAWRDPRSLHRYQHVTPSALPGHGIGELLRDHTRKTKKSA